MHHKPTPVIINKQKRVSIPMLLPFYIALLCTTLSLQATGKTPSTQDPAEKVIAEETAKLMALPGYQAVSGVIYIRGKARHFHYGKLNNGKKPDNNTIYEIGSITKTYTGLLLAQAVYDRKINLDEDVRHYLDGGYPNLVLAGGRPITIRHLVTHTAGLPLLINCADMHQAVTWQDDCYRRFKQEDFFNALKMVQLIDSSGDNYHYSGTGLQLIGYILERVYHKSQTELLRKYVFARSGERQTFSVLQQEGHPHISTGNTSEGKPAPLINGFYTYSGGMKSTTASMLDYMRMYLESNDPVVQQSMDRLAGDAQRGRAYAWNTFAYDQAGKMLYHNGGSFGHSSWIALYPRQKAGIFIVTNVVTADAQRLLNELSNRIVDRLGIIGK